MSKEEWSERRERRRAADGEELKQSQKGASIIRDQTLINTLLMREKEARPKLAVLLTFCFHPSLAQHGRAKQQINQIFSRQNALSSGAAVMSSKSRENNIMGVMKWNAEGSQIKARLKQNCDNMADSSTSQAPGFLLREARTATSPETNFRLTLRGETLGGRKIGF